MWFAALGAATLTPALLSSALWLLPAPASCRPDEQPMLLAQMFLGRNIGTVPGVSDEEFRHFVAQELTPRFPAGLTVSSATGQWRDPEDGVIHERSNVVTLLVWDGLAERAALEGARRAYLSRFRQQSVILAAHRVCTRL